MKRGAKQIENEVGGGSIYARTTAKKSSPHPQAWIGSNTLVT
jgi:hypothetical protein